MACPWFYPTRPIEDGRWAVAPRVPLIEPWEGECRAGADRGAPDGDALRGHCNFGYARGSCARFVDGRGDAVRFHAQPDAASGLRIFYFYERECWPAGHGEIAWDAAGGRACCDDEILRRQAEAFASAYRRRTGAI